MLATIQNPDPAVPLDKALTVSFKPELNKYRGSLWVEVWVVLGKLYDPEDEDSFVEYVIPTTGAAALYFKIEDGCHPLRPGMALGKCGTCGAWHNRISGECGEDGCAGAVSMYDGFSRIRVPPEGCEGDCCFTAISEKIMKWLISEEVPDPDTWELVKVLDATINGG